MELGSLRHRGLSRGSDGNVNVERETELVAASYSPSLHTVVSVTESSAPHGTTCCQRTKTNFQQQRLHAWNPVFTPNKVICFFFLFGLLFLISAIAFIAISAKVVECKKEYPSPREITPPERIEIRIDRSDCTGLDEGKSTITSSSLYLFYQIENFYQNHRRYLLSLSESQLMGKVLTEPSQVRACQPQVKASDGRILSPCGLIAASLHNDTYSLYQLKDATLPATGGNLESIFLDESRQAITVPNDFGSRFKNPQLSASDSQKVFEWIDELIFPGRVENPHFAVWMRTEIVPNFRKAYAKIPTKSIKLPLIVSIINRYPVSSMDGKKYVVITTLSYIGSKNFFLGIGCLVLGAVLLGFSAFFYQNHRKKPRVVGDIRYLRWSR